ncbi:acyl-CoA reductase [Dyadobacter subterraneus]|uniref:Acyl-CoA reductase n=1 Tax=Dyadobacter subterraneus TaxID=2773304 RepID=A0ABR9WAU2_9BACT|nr:acyl-CoA reductase [Dyadobacter subterraneus]MBE9462565.1 acyl-CoA reductase [Dyadobacter subterraneus]
MISRIQRINAFIKLGNFLKDPQNSDYLQELAISANRKNNWFTPVNVLGSLDAIATRFLSEKNLTTWVNQYPEPETSLKIGVIMAGNIPAVGFHDVLCVLISGHKLLAKPSSDDPVLIPALLEKLIEIETAFSDYIFFVERLNDSDAYIATGSDNTARYFHYYFSKKPNIIRKNRTSLAVITGNESESELTSLGKDILQYFGLGCRNVSKLYIPEGYDFTKFFESIQSFDQLCLNHHKYFNNYEYNKSILLVNRVLHYDIGFLMLTESPAMVSPISVVHYETYENVESMKEYLEENSEKIQCVVGDKKYIPNAIPFGHTQEPELSDYADSVDTMAFLTSL